MVSKLGQNLDIEAGLKPENCLCKGSRAPDEPHHDHIIDFAHDRLLLKLGSQWDSWVTSDALKFYNTLIAAIDLHDKQLVRRFKATWVCNECNPKDGNWKEAWLKKVPTDKKRLKYYSMYPGDLATCRTKESWEQTWKKDEKNLSRRLYKVQLLVDKEVGSYVSTLWNATWQLNLSASKLSGPSGQKRETRVTKLLGEQLELVATGADVSGRPIKFSYKATFDGKRNKMVGNPIGDYIGLKRVSPLRLDESIRKGRAISVTKMEVSADGMHLTLSRNAFHGELPPTDEILVFDKK